jgi:glycosyltransferase involved in cell wall biosynthesis
MIGSTDRSREIARSFAEVTLLQQSRGGPSAARNLGISRARGDFVAFLDADDVWLPEKLAKQAALLAERPQVDLVYTGAIMTFPDGHEEPWAWVSAEEAVERLPFYCCVLPSSTVVRTTVMQAHPWSTEYGSSEDWELFYRLTKQCTFDVVPEPTLYYRQHPESLSTRNWQQIFTNARRVSELIQRDYQGLPGFQRKHRVDARLHANAAVGARSAGSPDYLKHLLLSIATWPLPLSGKRRRMLPSMVARRVAELWR